MNTTTNTTIPEMRLRDYGYNTKKNDGLRERAIDSAFREKGEHWVNEQLRNMLKIARESESIVLFKDKCDFIGSSPEKEIKKIMDETNKGFMKHLGGLELKQISDTQYEFIVEVKEMHLNTGKIAHGGFLSTIADTGMGTAAHRVAGDRRCVTINLDLKFISAGQLGDKLKGDVKILKKTKTLVFISCEISNDKEIVVSASGTWKIL